MSYSTVFFKVIVYLLSTSPYFKLNQGFLRSQLTFEYFIKNV